MKYMVFPVLLSLIFLCSCGEGGSKKEDQTMTSDTVVTGLEGSRDQSGQLLTDVKPDTNSGQSEKVDPLGKRADSINAINGSSDERFVQDAVNGNTEEIGMAKMAQAQASNKEIRKIAGELESDHTAALKSLNALSSRKKYNNSPTPLPVSNDMTSLKAKKGADFDKAWCAFMIEKHKATIANYEENQRSVTDSDLKAWISENLPKLRVHNDHLMAVHGKL